MMTTSVPIPVMKAPIPSPFVKWAGGKRKLVATLMQHIPAEFDTYREPCVGGGALFFAMRPERAVLSDINQRLVRTYVGVRDHVEDVIALLQQYPNDKAFFLKMRNVYIDSRSDAEVAAWLIYLNHTCFNGLYRVNRSNRFNVPFGKYQDPVICDAPNLRACSVALQGVEIRHQDFANVVAQATPADAIYFDPPYAPASKTSSFTGYSAGGFSFGDQIRLRDAALQLKARGARIVISNSDTQTVRDLYREGFTLTTIQAARAINSKGDGRGKVDELVIA